MRLIAVLAPLPLCGCEAIRQALESMSRATVVMLPLALGGCIDAAMVLEDLRKTHDAIVTFVEDRHDSRRNIRSECDELLTICVQRHQEDGNLAGAAKVLAAAYAPPVTIEAVNKVLDRSDGPEINAFTEAHVCRAVAEHCPSESSSVLRVRIVEPD